MNRLARNTVVVSSLGLIFGAPRAHAQLIGANFGPVGSTSPSNWTLFTAAGTQSLSNELGAATGVSLTVSGPISSSPQTPTPSTIPIHSPSLSALQGNFYNAGFNTTPLVAVYSGLVPLETYDIFVFGERSVVSMDQTITVTGNGTPITFSQSGPVNDFFVNGSLGSSSENLSDYALPVTATSAGTISINAAGVAGSAGGSTFTVSGVAIVSAAAAPEPTSFALAGIILPMIGSFIARRR